MRSAVAGAALWAFAAVMFLVYPVLRPYSSEVGMEGAEAFGTQEWVVSHVCAMLGFIAVALALRNLEARVDPAARSTLGAAVVVMWIGVGLTLTYYGAEAFALNAVGARTVSESDTAWMELTDPIRNGALQISLFGVGLLLVLVGGVLAALGIQRSKVLPGWSGWVLAVGFALFLPQFFASPAIRIAHGVLMCAGCLVLAWATRTERTRTELAPSVA